jgi:hypothetical protein
MRWPSTIRRSLVGLLFMERFEQQLPGDGQNADQTWQVYDVTEFMPGELTIGTINQRLFTDGGIKNTQEVRELYSSGQ